jgi:PAS domain S-box-containing protein
VQVKTLADLAPIGIFQSDAAGVNSYTNAAWQEIWKLTQHESLGSGWVQCIHRDDVTDVRKKWTEAGRSGTPMQTEFRICRSDGEVRHVRLNARRESSEHAAEYAYVGSIEDITERHLLDQEHNEVSLLLEGNLNEIYIFDAETLRFEFVNEGARRNLGYTMNELRQMTPVDLKPYFNVQEFEAAIASARRRNRLRC